MPKVVLNKAGDRRGMKDQTPKARLAAKYNWLLLQLRGGIGNLCYMVRNLERTDCQKSKATRNYILSRLRELEVLIHAEIEASREQAKKNLTE